MYCMRLGWTENAVLLSRCATSAFSSKKRLWQKRHDSMSPTSYTYCVRVRAVIEIRVLNSLAQVLHVFLPSTHHFVPTLRV